MDTAKRIWFFDGDDCVWMDLRSRTIFMPYDRNPDTYGTEVKALIDKGYVVQLEIV